MDEVGVDDDVVRWAQLRVVLEVERRRSFSPRAASLSENRSDNRDALRTLLAQSPFLPSP